VDLPDALVLLLVALLILGWLVALASRRALREARRQKRSQSAKYGNLTEQFAPWMRGWPFDPAGFRFLGKPVDGVQFEKDAVYLVEIKAAGSALSPEQRALREAVLAGRVGWARFNVSDARDVEVVRPWERDPVAR
jgi:predicted Holliday junction resolvase-like endonuclease